MKKNSKIKEYIEKTIENLENSYVMNDNFMCLIILKFYATFNVKTTRY